MKKLIYSEQLKDPRWQKMRLEIMERDEFRCVMCAEEEKTLNVHHLIYRKGKMVWESPKNDLVTLCEDCHSDITKSKIFFDEFFAKHWYFDDCIMDILSKIEEYKIIPSYTHELVKIMDIVFGDVRDKYNNKQSF